MMAEAEGARISDELVQVLILTRVAFLFRPSSAAELRVLQHIPSTGRGLEHGSLHLTECALLFANHFPHVTGLLQDTLQNPY